MANITIDPIHLTGEDLFFGSDNFLNELVAEEIDIIKGGWYSITSGYNSLFGNGISSNSNSYGSFSSNSSGYGGYYHNSWC